MQIKTLKLNIRINMKLSKAAATYKCKHGHTINSGDYYYPQRRNKKLCFECGRKRKPETFLIKLLKLLA